MSIHKTIELNIVHPVDPADGSGYEVKLLDITVASQPETVFIQGANSVPGSPFKYDFALHEGHLKFGNQYRVTVRLNGLHNEVYSDERDFSVTQNGKTEVVGLKLSRG